MGAAVHWGVEHARAAVSCQQERTVRSGRRRGRRTRRMDPPRKKGQTPMEIANTLVVGAR